MGANSKIEWTHHTFNPWRGCTKVSDGCKNCYAETMSKRNPKVLGIWGDNGTRIVASESMWREPVKWNAGAEAAGERRRVFCASLADVCEDRPELIATRTRLFNLVHDTPHLDWLLLSKRPENYMRLFGTHWPQNVWAGTSVENQQTADERIPHLLRVPAAVRFLSCEPLIAPIDLNPAFYQESLIYQSEGKQHPVPKGWTFHSERIGWVIVGGESGPGARPCDLAWIRSIIDQCKAAQVPVFCKQLGASIVNSDEHRGPWPVSPANYMRIGGNKGGDIAEFPADLRVREWPKASVRA